MTVRDRYGSTPCGRDGARARWGSKLRGHLSPPHSFAGAISSAIMMSASVRIVIATLCFVFGANTAVGSTAISFVSIGDWGGAALEDYHKTDEITVAKSFAASAAALQAQFVLNTGDNFYYYGVKSTTDPCGRILLSKFITKIV